MSNEATEAGTSQAIRLFRCLLRQAAGSCPIPRLRHALLRWSGITIGRRAFVNMGVRFVDGYRRGAIRIGERAAIAPGVIVVASSDPNHSRLAEKKDLSICGTVHIGADAWIGAGAIILPNQHVGNRAIIGAGAVVTRSVLDDQVVGGVPAYPLRRNTKEGT